ncbi:MAG TPA: hypothetical protein VM846_08785 [Vicinamibacterales bacterium]|nr:hypothetical protein [Vicinamibacterales bacterium]
MSLIRLLAAGTAAVAFAAVAVSAGTMFRVEIGSPVALGVNKYFKKVDKKVVLAVRAVVCEDLANVRITGTAEGLVAGKRQSLPITLTAVEPVEAVYAIQQQWPEAGAWVLHLKGTCANPKAEASTIVAVSKGTFIREKSEVLREPATKKQIDDAVAALARSQS